MNLYRKLVLSFLAAIILQACASRRNSNEYDYAADTIVAETGPEPAPEYVYRGQATTLLESYGSNREYFLNIRRTPSGNPYLVYEENNEKWQGLAQAKDTLIDNEIDAVIYRSVLRYGSRSLPVDVLVAAKPCAGQPASEQQSVTIRAGRRSYSGCAMQGGY